MRNVLMQVVLAVGNVIVMNGIKYEVVTTHFGGFTLRRVDA